MCNICPCQDRIDIQDGPGRGHRPREAPGADASLLVLPEETDLTKGILNFFDVVEMSARSLEPHRVTFSLIELVAAFHSYYNKARVLRKQAPLTLARLTLLKVLPGVIREGLEMLGVSAPEKMEQEPKNKPTDEGRPSLRRRAKKGPKTIPGSRCRQWLIPSTRLAEPSPFPHMINSSF